MHVREMGEGEFGVRGDYWRLMGEWKGGRKGRVGGIRVMKWEG